MANNGSGPSLLILGSFLLLACGILTIFQGLHLGYIRNTLTTVAAENTPFPCNVTWCQFQDALCGNVGCQVITVTVSATIAELNLTLSNNVTKVVSSCSRNVCGMAFPGNITDCYRSSETLRITTYSYPLNEGDYRYNAFCLGFLVFFDVIALMCIIYGIVNTYDCWRPKLPSVTINVELPKTGERTTERLGEKPEQKQSYYRQTDVVNLDA